MLHRSSAVHMRLRRPRRGIPKAPFCWCACDGVGYRPGRNHGEYRCSLYVFSFIQYSIPGMTICSTRLFFFLDAYTNDCFPKHRGEISALLNITRVFGGFSVAYFQVPWATKHGALQTFGCEAA